MTKPRRWFCYVVRCCDGSLYSGITTDLDRRVAEHNGSKAGAKYTRSRRPVSLVFSESYGSRSSAASHEALLKRLSREQKLAHIEKWQAGHDRYGRVL